MTVFLGSKSVLIKGVPALQLFEYMTASNGFLALNSSEKTLCTLKSYHNPLLFPNKDIFYFLCLLTSPVAANFEIIFPEVLVRPLAVCSLAVYH